MNPALISALIQLGPAAYQMIQGIKQTREGKEMQKNLGARVNYEIPEAAKQALGVMQSLASSREMSGQSNLENKLDLSQAGALGNIAQSGAMSSQDMMAALTNLGGQRMMQEQDIAQSAAQDYQQRQQALSSAYGNFAGYQEAKQADRQKDWYERARAAAAMRGAGMQNTMGAIQGLSSAVGGVFASGALDDLFKKDKNLVKDIKFTEDVEKLSGEIENPVGYVPPGMSGDQMLGVTGMNNTGGFNYQTPFSQAPQLTSNYGSITGQLPGNQIPVSTSPYTQGAWGQTPQSALDFMKFLGTSGINF